MNKREHAIGTPGENGSLDTGIINVSRPASPRQQRGGGPQALPGSSIYELPPETETRDLLGRYFGNSGLLYPFIHEATFLQTYEQLKAENFTKTRRTWLGILNMILATASNVAVRGEKSASERIAESEVFYNRALGLCQKQILRGTSLEIGPAIPFEYCPILTPRNYSPIPSACQPVPTGHSEVSSDLGNTWGRRQSCTISWFTFQSSFEKVLTI